MRNNPLLDVVCIFPGPARRALYAAATSGQLQRGTWRGCPLNRAGAELGYPVRSRGEAAFVLGISPEVALRFVEVWDRQWGSSRRRSKLLREALERVGLSVDEGSAGPPEPAESESARVLISCG